MAIVLLLVAASLRCPWEWRAALAQMNVAALHREARQPLPMGMPIPGCENESGCICRGATLAHFVDARWLHDSAGSLLVEGRSIQSPTGVADEAGVGFSGSDLGSRFHLLPLSGRQLRARYASFVI